MMVHVDPTGHFKDTGAIVPACGLILSFAAEAFHEHPRGTVEDIYSTMMDIYHFGGGPMTGGTVDPETGVYSYPEDPDLYPLVQLTYPDSDVTVYVYQYAIVAIVDPSGTTIVTRMD